MRPDAAEILRGVQTVLLDVIAPDLQTPAVRAQAGYAAGLLDIIAQAWEDESERLAAEIGDLLATFGRLAALLASAEGDLSELVAELQRTAEASKGSTDRRALRAEAERLRHLLERLVGFAGWPAGAGALSAGADEELRGLLRRTAERSRGFAT